MEALKSIYESFSTRELASATLLMLFFIWTSRSKGVRKSILNFAKSFLTPQLFRVEIVLFLWIFLVCYIVYCFDIWRIDYTKDIIIYTLGTIPLLWKVTKYSSQEDFSKLIIKQIKLATIITAYLNLYSLSYVWEIIAQISIGYIAITEYTIKFHKGEDNSSKQLYGCINKCYTCLGLTYLFFTLYKSVTTPIFISFNMLTQAVALPLFFTIAVCPYLYMFTIYCAYESWFVRLLRSVRDNEAEYNSRKILLVRKCHINLKKIRYFERYIKLFTIRNKEEFIYALNQCEKGYKRRANFE